MAIKFMCADMMRRVPNAFLGLPVSSVSFIDSLPADKHVLNDMRFRFKVDNLWAGIADNHPDLKPHDYSKDIQVE
jgi:hypothetical protein